MASDEILADAVESILNLLRTSMPPLLEEGHVVVARPDQFQRFRESTEPTLTVFLYRITLNESMRNTTRRLLPNGRLELPRVPLNLQFLLTSWATDVTTELRILGKAIQILHDNTDLRAAQLFGSSWEPEDSIQLLIDSAPTEEQVRVWETTGLPYRLSTTFVARVSSLSPREQGDVADPVNRHLVPDS
jgi:hypothetical protein